MGFEWELKRGGWRERLWTTPTNVDSAIDKKLAITERKFCYYVPR
jgi:hypothetical protein